MRKFGLVLLAALMVIPASQAVSQACTTFVIRSGQDQVYGRNYDWQVGNGMVVVNKRGVVKSAYVMRGMKCKPAQWVAKYGSVTFNQFGREFPMGGMNQAGLVIAAMSLEGSRPPELKGQACVGMALQWRQYILDTCATVAEAIASYKKVALRYNPNSKAPGTHVLLTDKNGHSAAIEFIDGKFVVYTGKDLPVTAMTNDTYESSLDYYKSRTGPTYDRWNSIKRFCLAAKMVADYAPQKEPDLVAYAFKVLSAVGSGNTQWSIVHDNQRMRTYFRSKDHAAIREIDFKALDFSCTAPVLVLDINAPLKGDVTAKLKPCTPEINLRAVQVTFSNSNFLRNLPPALVKRFASYPDSLKCGK